MIIEPEIYALGFQKRRENRLVIIRQARQELEAEAAPLAAWERQEEAAEAEEAAQKAPEEDQPEAQHQGGEVS